VIRKYNLDFIFLVTPETSASRVKKLDELSTGFLYAVSSSSTTGASTDGNKMPEYLHRLQALDLKNPVLVGFGIRDRNSFDEACKNANGAIIGSAYITALKGGADVSKATREFLTGILD
jgi:tryptophan synthase alpha chain